MATSRTIVLALRNHNHPAGQRTRAGFIITTKPTAYSVTKDEERLLRDDPAIRIIERGTAFDDAMDRYVVNHPEAAITEPKNPTTKKEPETVDQSGQEDTGSKPEKVKPLNFLTHEELISELEKKGLVAGKDFSVESETKALRELLASLAL